MSERWDEGAITRIALRELGQKGQLQDVTQLHWSEQCERCLHATWFHYDALRMEDGPCQVPACVCPAELVVVGKRMVEVPA